MATTRKMPPGRSGLPLLGETLAWLKDRVAFAKSRRERFGPIFRTHLFGNPTVYVCGAEANRWLFAGESKWFVNQWPASVRALLGDGSMAVLEGEPHRARRKLLAPHFVPARIHGTCEWIDEVVARHLATWSGEVELVSAFKALAFEIAARFLVSDLDAASRQALSEWFDAFVAGLFAPAPIAIPGTAFARAVAAKRRMTALLSEVVQQRLREGVQDPPRDALDILLGARDEDGSGMSAEHVVQELQLFLFAGHDTTVTSLTNAMYHLAQYPEVLERVRAEQDALGPGPITVERARSAKELLYFIQESLRVVPPIGDAFRVALQDLEFGGYAIRKGWTVAMYPAGSHADPSAFEDPERFDPQRFAPPREEHRATAVSWIPFGGGARTCIGQHFAMMEMQIALSRIVRDYRWEVVNIDGPRVTVPFPLPKDGGRVRWHRREDGAASVTTLGQAGIEASSVS